MNTIDPSILGKFQRIQSTLQVLPENKSLLECTYRGLTEIPGIVGAGSCLEGEFFPGTINLNADTEKILASTCSTCTMLTENKKAQTPPACAVVNLRRFSCIELQTGSGYYGLLLIQSNDTTSYARYEPYVRNIASLLTLLLENRRQKNTLKNIREELELAVQERTQALAESEERYAAVVKQASEGIYLLDPETKEILEMNDSLKGMIGAPEIEAHDLVVYDFVDHPREEIDKIIKNVVSCGDFFVGERKYRRLDGILFDVEASAKLIGFGGKEILCVIARDISERKRAERERERLEESLRHARKMEAIGTLAGGIAHDFNNILSAIIGYSELIKINLPSDSRAVRDIDEIVKSGMRAADLVKKILAFSGKLNRSLQITNPNPFIKEALAMMKATLPATVVLEEDVDRQCGLVRLDPMGMHQIVLNLCTNALQSLPDGRGQIRVRLFRREDVNEEMNTAICLAVSDNGRGMDKETIDRAFEPYFTTKAVGKGSGLGLAVVHGIVKGYGGTITVDSQPGRGSTFTVSIPVADDILDQA